MYLGGLDLSNLTLDLSLVLEYVFTSVINKRPFHQNMKLKILHGGGKDIYW